MAAKIVGSNEPDFPADALKPRQSGYGQNGYGGASSDLPHQNTRSGYLPGPGTPVNDQLRKVKADPYPTTFGNKNPNAK